MHIFDDPDFDADAAELRMLDRLERAYQQTLLRHPDCRDPDHPGCELCREDQPTEDDDDAHP